MNNKGVPPFEVIEPDSGSPPVPCRYVLIYAEQLHVHSRFMQTNRQDGCTIPIEKKQILLCLPETKLFSDIASFDELSRTKKFIYTAKDILQRDIHDLKGWDLIGYTIKPKPKARTEPKPKRQPRRGYGPNLWHSNEDEDEDEYGVEEEVHMSGFYAPPAAQEESTEELVLVARIWGKGFADQLLK
ncbi:hypothetical protein FRC09_013361 [Ceratobasidium sp. 395]|nr:hypothetical protein FRC09_013361 [Ceratobasidium sp. 395]